MLDGEWGIQTGRQGKSGAHLNLHEQSCQSPIVNPIINCHWVCWPGLMVDTTISGGPHFPQGSSSLLIKSSGEPGSVYNILQSLY